MTTAITTRGWSPCSPRSARAGGCASSGALEEAGETVDAAAEYRAAARLTTSLPEQRYLLTRASRLHTGKVHAWIGDAPDR